VTGSPLFVWSEKLKVKSKITATGAMILGFFPRAEKMVQNVVQNVHI
jgi:hypothetical protein